MVRLGEIAAWFEETVPNEMKMDFDNVGFLVGDSQNTVTKVLTALDITDEVVDEAVDEGVGRVVDAVTRMGGVCFITADHGNAEQMTELDGSPFTAHTTNPVPFVVTGYDCKLREGGRLCDIAPTMLEVLDLPKPAEMDGVSLFL